MGIVITFPAGKVRPVSTRDAADLRGEIYILPSIRIERHVETAAPHSPNSPERPAGKTRRRAR